MQRTTHDLISAACALLILPPEPLVFVAVPVAVFAGRLPDVDLRLRGVRHRGITHSAALVALVAFVAYRLSHPVAWCAALAYAGHVAADMLTKQGVLLLYPLKRPVAWLPKPVRFVTGSRYEKLFAAIVAAALLYHLVRIDYVVNLVDSVIALARATLGA